MKRIVLITFIISTLVSCKSIFLNMMLKNPKVETVESIKAFQEKNGFASENTFILKGDASTASDQVKKGMFKGYSIYDADGNLLCYQGSETCSGIQFKTLLNGNAEEFEVCENKPTLDEFLKKCLTLEGQSIQKSQLKLSDYYVVYFWQKFIGGKKGYKESIGWAEDELAKQNSGKAFTLLKVNADIQEAWGFKAGDKGKVKYKGGSIKVTIPDGV